MAASCREDIETCIQKGHKFRCRANSSQRSSSSRTSRTSQPGGCEAMRTTYLVAFQPPTTQARTAQPAYIIPSSLRYAKVDLFGKHEKQHLRAVKLLGKQHYFGTPTFVRLAPFSRDRTRNPCMMLCKDVSLNGTIAAAEGARLGAISWSQTATITLCSPLLQQQQLHASHFVDSSIRLPAGLCPVLAKPRELKESREARHHASHGMP